MHNAICQHIEFHGGIGNQMISTAALFVMSRNSNIFADLSYFDNQPICAAVDGKSMSYWNWELNHFGFDLISFNEFKLNRSIDSRKIDDQSVLRHGLYGLNKFCGEIFQISPNHLKLIYENYPFFQNIEFIAVHLRRGDYLNVASLLVSVRESLPTLRQLAKIILNIVVFSDSPVNHDDSLSLQKLIDDTGCNIRCFIGGSPVITHHLLRLSTVLICANSQFSLSAAALRRPDQLTIVPAQHDALIYSGTNQVLAGLRRFQISPDFSTLI